MNFFFYTVAVLFIIFFSTGCSKKSKVIDGYIAENKQVSIGKALADYKYFKTISWSEIDKDDGTNVILAECEIDLDKDPQGRNFKQIAKKASVIFVFKIADNNNVIVEKMRGKYTAIGGEVIDNELPVSPSWMIPKQVFIERIFEKQPFTDITAQILLQK